MTLISLGHQFSSTCVKNSDRNKTALLIKIEDDTMAEDKSQIVIKTHQYLNLVSKRDSTNTDERLQCHWMASLMIFFSILYFFFHARIVQKQFKSACKAKYQLLTLTQTSQYVYEATVLR
jgi:hypothetical protein